jgi:hypothetical protein
MRLPSSIRSTVLLLAVAVSMTACATASPASPLPTAVPSPFVAASPDLTPVPGGPAAPSAVPGADGPLTEGEAMLVAGLRADLHGACEPVRDQLPVGAVASLACVPTTGDAAAARIDLFDASPTLLDAYVAPVEAAGVPFQSNDGSCFGSDPAEGAWVPGDGLDVRAERQACWTDADGVPWYIAIQPPYVLLTVTGLPGESLATAHRYAWLGNEDVPGAPTLWREIAVDAEK